MGEGLLFVPELSKGGAFGLGLRIGTQPQRHKHRLHRLPHYPHHVVPEGVQVRLVAQPGAEGLERPGRVVLAAVEASVDERLDAATQRVEQRRYYEGGDDYGQLWLL